MSSVDRARAYTTTLQPLPGKKARVPVLFDPNKAWGAKREHHVNGTVAGMRVRVTITQDDTGWSFSLSPARLRDCPVGPGDAVEVVISPEAPSVATWLQIYLQHSRRTPRLGRSSTRSPSSTETATCGGSTGRSAGRTFVHNGSPR